MFFSSYYIIISRLKLGLKSSFPPGKSLILVNQIKNLTPLKITRKAERGAAKLTTKLRMGLLEMLTVFGVWRAGGGSRG